MKTYNLAIRLKMNKNANIDVFCTKINLNLYRILKNLYIQASSVKIAVRTYC